MNKQRQQDIDEEKHDKFVRVDIDTHQAKQNIASLINENLHRVN